MKTLKDNIKDIFTDIIGAVFILAAVVLYLLDKVDLTKGSILFLVGVAFFFIPDDILSQMAQRIVKKKIGDNDEKKPAA